MSDRETLCRLYLELSQVVPEGTRTAREVVYELRIKSALQKLVHATPKTRNGPCIQAIGHLRDALGLPPMSANGRADEGLES